MFRVTTIIAAAALISCGGSAQNVGPKTSPAEAVLGEPIELELSRPEAPGEGTPAPILEVMKEQLDVSMAALKERPELPPYYAVYQVTDRKTSYVSASLGGLLDSSQNDVRTLDVDVRVGDHELDNTHPLRGDPMGSAARFDSQSWLIPQGDDPAMLKPPLWLATDTKYKEAVEAYLQVKGNEAVKAKAEDSSADFSREEPVRFIQAPAEAAIDQAAWEERVRAYSALFKGHPELYLSEVDLKVEAVTRYSVSSEGSMAQLGRTHARLSFWASTRAHDGMDLFRFDAIDVSSLDKMPADEEIRRRIEQVVADTVALRKAPLAEPYVGPAILGGKAAGVYFHEIFGHRVEGHRQKDEEEGQTFAKKVGEKVMPAFIDVFDDPTVRSINGIELNGYYPVDDELVRARNATLIDSGVLRGFLMSRSPTRGFDRSNGHGRREEGNTIVARQGNLVVRPKGSVAPDRLKELLIEEVKRQGKSYGLRFTVVQGGFTNTSRWGFQSFKVLPVMVYKVYADGREELIRGASIDGTPLTSLSQIIAAGDDVEVFNGHCGAESGFVPVSATSPSLLIRRVEISRAPSGKEKPAILPPPPGDEDKGNRGESR